jgi:hypothetical protein
MHGTYPAAATAASFAPIASGRGGVASDSDPAASDNDEDWFYKIAIANLGSHDTGLALHVVSRSPEGSCYKYVARNPEARRQPPSGLIRTLLRTPQGWQWLCGLMDGSDAEWWQEIVRAKRKSDAYDAA